MSIKKLIIAGCVISSSHALAICKIATSAGGVAKELSDVLFVVANDLEVCPQNVFELKASLLADGLETKPSMVANRGRHNPKFGSFSFFEVAAGHSSALNQDIGPGHFYFGHFTNASAGVVDLDQAPAPGKLMVELIAWDFTKEVFNFYELIGTANGGKWFYRGDSKDALLDNKFLHLQPDPANPQFGKRMRCSACHSSGGPIMKELEHPHNDWWTESRPLTFGSNKPSAHVKKWLADTVDAKVFSAAVGNGIDLLEQSESMKNFKKSLSLQEQLRPLFCTSEINLVSDSTPLADPSGNIKIPASYFINPLILAADPLVLDKSLYLGSMQQLGFQFPETNQIDADHAWLAPVKGHSDLTGIKSLIDAGVIDAELVADILAVDFKNPLFSQSRCKLLRLVPSVSNGDWVSEFKSKLQGNGAPAAQELLKNLNNADRTQVFHAQQAEDYLHSLIVDSPAAVDALILKLDQTRSAVFSNEISKNPMGQILEPGFRVIFPVRSSLQ